MSLKLFANMGKSKKDRADRESSSVESTPAKKKLKDNSGQSSADRGGIKLINSVQRQREGDSDSANSEISMDMSRPAPPQWFKDFELRQEARFEEVINSCKDAHDALNFDIKNLKDDLEQVKTELKQTILKLDDLENRNRRNNIVIFNLPEGSEGPSCIDFIKTMLNDDCGLQPSIQRAHRSGVFHREAQKPRPIHVGFALYPEKETCRKALVELFKKKKFGASRSVRLFVSNDFSKKVQQMRREKIPELRRLKEQGHQAFLVYPATIKIRDPAGRIRDP